MRNHFHHVRYELKDQVSWEDEARGELKTVFKDGKNGT
jgi:hypothetical protein